MSRQTHSVHTVSRQTHSVKADTQCQGRHTVSRQTHSVKVDTHSVHIKIKSMFAIMEDIIIPKDILEQTSAIQYY